MAIGLEKKRKFKRLGMEVSELGFGAWGIGGRYVGSTTRIESREAILAYLEAGGNFIDTAINYGESERIIGSILEETGFRDKVYIGTKTKSGEFSDTVPQLRRDLEISLKNLRREYVDIFYLHWPPEDEHVIEMALSECEKFREEGKIRGIGVSVKGPSVTDATVSLCRKFVDTDRIDVIQLVYSILRQKNREAMKYADAQGVGIVVRTSLESGFLTGKYPIGTRFGEDDHRSRWNQKADGILKEVEHIREKHLRGSGIPLEELAIRFALAPRETTTVIVGAKNAAQLHANIRASTSDRIAFELLETLAAEYRDFTESCNPAD